MCHRKIACDKIYFINTEFMHVVFSADKQFIVRHPHRRNSWLRPVMMGRGEFQEERKKRCEMITEPGEWKVQLLISV